MKTSPDIKVIGRSLIGQSLERALKLTKEGLDVEARTIPVAISSDEPVLQWVNGRGVAYVILDHAKKSINLERFKNGASLLEGHDWDKRIGRVRNPETDGHVLRGLSRFYDTTRPDEVFREVLSDLDHGDSTGCSVGFTIERIADKIEGYIDEIPIVRATKWTPYELSVVSIEADLKAGIARSKTGLAPGVDDDEDVDDGETPNPPTEVRTKTMKPTLEEQAAADAAALATRTPAQLLQVRTTEFVDTAALFGETDEEKVRYRTMARTFALDDSKTLDDLKRDILASMKEAQTAAAVVDPKTLGARQGIVPIRRYQSLKVFKGEGADERAYRFGMAFLANACAGARGAENVPMIKRAVEYAREHGLLQRTGQVEGVNEDGGFTVQEEWSQDFIDLREKYGVIRRHTKIEPMASETKTILRRTGGLTFYAAGEEDSVTVSKKTWDRVGLVAKKWLCMGKMSSEINEDSIINQADDLASEMAYAAARLEDNCGFNADGTGDPASATGYQGIVGILKKLLNLSATRANIAGLKVGSGNLWSELVLTDFEAVVGLLPQYADTPNAKWFAHRTFYFNVMKKLLLAQTGANATEASEMRQPIFLGYPVEFSQVLPKTEANDQIPCVFGDLSLGSRLGNRSDLTIMLSEHSSFATDAIDIRGRVRFDFTAHDVGNASGTAADREPGPIVGLLTAAS